jgi:hypothetical protein
MQVQLEVRVGRGGKVGSEVEVQREVRARVVRVTAGTGAVEREVEVEREVAASRGVKAARE